MQVSLEKVSKIFCRHINSKVAEILPMSEIQICDNGVIDLICIDSFSRIRLLKERREIPERKPERRSKNDKNRGILPDFNSLSRINNGMALVIFLKNLG